ncbi:amidase [Pseudomonas sp. JQ170]|uniref:amidase n=1 Tax=unclassified Pseudomonas TaxID=196821 RepID=UPI00264F15B7|nr:MULTISPECIES: amidase [unclassified Pseudomonas]MDN7143779.1 amidase [Pseudomonas sp. JQ170]WRO75404.1 amidase [Pseudomonas sp. 170C]
MTDKTTLGELTAVELLALYERKEVSPVEVTEDVLARIAQHNPAVNAYCHVDEEGARAAARASEKRWQQGNPCGRLDGVPSSIKDLTLTRGMPTRKGSRTTSSEGPWEVDAPFSAFMRAAGAVLVGKTTTPEFGWKGVTDNPLYGITRNPWNTRLTAGGSSGGAAAAAALNLGVLHQGSDAGGSIRIPCAFTGTFGIKPTFGYVPQWPASAMTILSHLGPMTRTVEDSVLMLDCVARPDARDGLAGAARQTPWLSTGDDLKGLRVAYSADFGYVKVDPQIQALVGQAVERLAQLGAQVEAVDPGFDDPVDIFNTLWFAGAARLLGQLTAEQRRLVDPGLQEIAQCGAGISLSEYTQALEARAALVARMNAFHERYDVLVTPTLPLVAFEAGHNVPPGSDLKQWMAWTPFSYPFNLTQQPAASVPCGFTDAGLPVGLHVVAGRFADEQVLKVCRLYERHFPSRHLQVPVIG